MPDGSVWYSFGSLSPLSKPMIKVLIPKGRTPPLWVYLCCTPATYFVMYSMVTGSSTVNRWDCASSRALSIRILASAFNPAKARQTCVSIRPIFDGVILVSCSFIADLFSQPRTTMSLPFTPTAQVPRLTASRAYSTWKTCPSGLNTRRACQLPFGFVERTPSTRKCPIVARSHISMSVEQKCSDGGCIGMLEVSVVEKKVSRSLRLR